MKRAWFIGGSLDGRSREDRPGDQFFNPISRAPIGCDGFNREVYRRTAEDEFTFVRVEPGPPKEAT